MSGITQRKLTYSEKLKDPRWQKKRLEILERDGWACQECGAKDKTLFVHHGYYETGKEPWEYENETLHSLCEPCHNDGDDLRREVAKSVAHLPVRNMLNLWTALSFLIELSDSKQESLLCDMGHVLHDAMMSENDTNHQPHFEIIYSPPRIKSPLGIEIVNRIEFKIDGRDGRSTFWQPLVIDGTIMQGEQEYINKMFKAVSGTFKPDSIRITKRPRIEFAGSQDPATD